MVAKKKEPTFFQKCDVEINKCNDLINSLQKQKDLFLRIQKVLPDVTGNWRWGCINSRNELTSPRFYSEIVNKDFDDLSFGGRGCCNDGDGDPYYVRAIKVVEGVRVMGTSKTLFARENRNYSGYDPENKWEEAIRDANGEKGVSIVRKFLKENPYESVDDFWDDEDEDDD
jgi:hypothetical protein